MLLLNPLPDPLTDLLARYGIPTAATALSPRAALRKFLRGAESVVDSQAALLEDGTPETLGRLSFVFAEFGEDSGRKTFELRSSLTSWSRAVPLAMRALNT